MQTYTIKEASKLSGLPDSTLRYYETMWLIDFIKRDSSSKHRTYTEEDINIISSITCLNISWLSIWKMKEYIKACDLNSEDYSIQFKILKEQEKKLKEEQKAINLRIKYIKWKIKYWKLLNSWDQELFKNTLKEIGEISRKLRFWDKK